jgi:hypothetical protein
VQQVKIGEKVSAEITVNIGMPQGSGLSPLLFIILMADMDLWIKNGQLCNFADDTSNVVVGKNKDDVIKKLEEDSDGIVKFMSSNNLVINPEKTGFLYIGGREPVQLCIGGDNIQSSNTETLLGMKLSSDLTWSDHIQALLSTLRQRIGIIRRLRYKISKAGLKVVVEGIFNSLIRYGVALYCKPRLTEGDKSNSVLEELQVLQNEVMRITLGYKMKDHIRREKIWEESGMMTINHMVCYHLIMETNNVIKFSASEELRERLIRHNDSQHVTRTKTRGDLMVPENVEKLNGFTYYGAKLWNRLPMNLRETLSVGAFKNGAKKWLKKNIPLL